MRFVYLGTGVALGTNETKFMSNNEQEPYNLPSSEQLDCYYYLRGLLQDRAEEVSDVDKKAFCNLILGQCPGAMNVEDIDLVQKLCPEEWRCYCEGEWGTPEELRTMEEERLIEHGWERGPDGEMYVPFP
jgi:hypothetical protein